MPIPARWTRLRRAVAVLLAVSGIAAVASAGLQDESGFLWIAESGGVLNIATDSGAVRFEIPQSLGTSALGVNDFNGDLWAYGNRRLRGFDRVGTPRVDVETPVPIHGGDPADLTVDGNAGVLWLAIKRELYRYDLQGTLQHTLTLPRNIVAATLDRDRSLLWVAQEQQVRLYDADGALQKTIDLAVTDRIADLAYDRRLGQVWLALPDRLQRYDAHGARVAEVHGNFAGAIAPDGAGGLWQARDGTLLHYDEAGAVQLSLQPFDGQADKAVVDLIADPQDASVWVASRKSVSHYAVDGERVDHLADLGDGVVRRLSRAALYADLDAPELAITAPGADSLLRDDRPTIQLSFFDLGVGVDAESIQIGVGGQAIAASCTTAATSATCVPAMPLADGEHVVSVTVADRALNRSEPAEVRLTIDTIPPTIMVSSPAAGSVTNQPVQTIRGSLDEAGTLTLDGTAVALDGAFRFDVEKTLHEGANAFEFAATDRAGNSSGHTLAVMLDTVPPALPVADLISVGESSAGRVAVTGAAGSVEPGSTVRVTNLRTGQTVTAVAASDGSFLATIEAEAGDELAVTVQDAATNASPALAASVPASLGVTIAEPVDGAAFPLESVLVAGSFRGPLNTAITVNGKPATMLSEGGEVKFYVAVPLQSGVNELKAVATLQDGSALSRSVSVTRTSSPFKIWVSRQTASAPATVSFNLTGELGFYDQIRYDFNGDGKFDYLSGASQYSNWASHLYSTPGVHRTVLQISRYNFSKRQYEVIFKQTISVAVLNGALLEQHVDQVLRSVWGGMNAALRAGDMPLALTALSFDSRPTYGEVFEPLLPQMGGILDDFTDIEPVVIAGEYAEYAIMNARGDNRVHIIGFVRGADGVWRVDQM